MDAYTLYEDLTVKWDAAFPPASSPVKPMYHIQTDVAELNHVLGASRSPHFYQILDKDKKPCEISVGNFKIEGSRLVEQLVQIERHLLITIVDKAGEKQTKLYKFNTVFDGGFALKLPELIRTLQEYNKFGSFAQLNELEKVKSENATLKQNIAQLEATLASERERINMLLREIDRLKEAATLATLPPNNPSSQTGV
ncbi:MAG: hypothetical protein OHK0038_13970 [Flammeovirgaceae bacterium]